MALAVALVTSVTGQMTAQPAVAAPALIDQCAKPASARVGGWVCPGMTIPTEKQRRADLMKLVAIGEVTKAEAAASTGFCSIDGCWDRINAIKSTFVGDANYGWTDVHTGKRPRWEPRT